MAWPEIVVGHADDGRLLDRRVGEQGRFHLAGADAVATALDQVGRLAADDAVPPGRRRRTPRRRSGSSRPSVYRAAVASGRLR